MKNSSQMNRPSLAQPAGIASICRELYEQRIGMVTYHMSQSDYEDMLGDALSYQWEGLDLPNLIAQHQNEEHVEYEANIKAHTVTYRAL